VRGAEGFRCLELYIDHQEALQIGVSVIHFPEGPIIKDVTRNELLEILYHQVTVALVLRYAERHLAITKVYYSHKHGPTHKGGYTELSIECGGSYKLLVQRLPSGYGCIWHPWSFVGYGACCGFLRGFHLCARLANLLRP
jgi:hypothetical protein